MWARVRQFREATKLPSPEDFALAAEAQLAGPLLDLFRQQHPRDIVHAAATARWLIERGHTDPELIAAALLHDVGKGHQRRRDRAGYVLANAVRGAKLLAGPGSRFEFRRALARGLAHSESGARALADAGASPRVVDLTRRHHSPPGSDTMLALLHEADAAS